MSKSTKIWLIVAVALVLLGGSVFAGMMAMLKWDFSKLSTDRYETNVYEINEDIQNVSLKTDTADITFVLSEDGKCRVECYEEETGKHSVSAEDGTLKIHLTENKKWYDYISFGFGSPKITVYLPMTEYVSLSIEESTGDIKMPKDFKYTNVDISLSTGDVEFSASVSETLRIKGSTGNIRIANVSASYLDLTVSTGDIKLSNVKCSKDITLGVSTGNAHLEDSNCRHFTSTGSTGDLMLTNVYIRENVSITRSTGDVTLNDCDATKLVIKTDTGDVTGSLLSEKIFVTQTDTGSVNVPNSPIGGLCEITTDTGDIKMTLK